ncbi:MAG: sigma-70 family RNA polymerase sigma factor [Bryobacterales bacterium]|nr:sigma-70 family RNA polymerase sigma factor [Bryobacterales bacterium]
MVDPGGDVTFLLKQWTRGDESALSSLAGQVHRELRTIADAYLRRERGGHTLQPTALVNEAWIRLVQEDGLEFDNRRRFFALAAQMMRQILVDHARAARSAKRGGGAPELAFAEWGPAGASASSPETFLILDEALNQLAARHPRHARVLELRYFGGLSLEDVAALLDISIATVSRDQKLGEALLSQIMSEPAPTMKKTDPESAR